MKLYTALDVSLRSVAICVVDERGEVRYEAKVEADVDHIVSCLRAFSCELRIVGFEAGTLTQYLTYGLQAAGFEVICLEARQVSAALAAMRNKTDRNDARGIAQILRTGWYSRVHVKSREPPVAIVALESQGRPEQVCRSGKRAAWSTEGLWCPSGQQASARFVRRRCSPGD
jgi:transposase